MFILMSNNYSSSWLMNYINTYQLTRQGVWLGQ